MSMWKRFTMLNNKLFAVVFAVFSINSSAYALTIAEVAEHQRNKSISAISPSKGAETPVAISAQSEMKRYNYKLVATYETPEGKRALVNNRGTLEALKHGERVNNMSIKSINDGSVQLQMKCKTKTNCKSLKVNIGDGF